MAIEVIFNIILGLLIVFYLYEAMQLPNIDDTVDVLGASGFPQIIGVLALLVLLFITINTIRENKAVQISLFNLRLPEGRLLLVNIFFLASYIVLLSILGFAVSTMLYLFIAPTSFGYSKWRLLTFFSVVGALVLVSVFGSVFYVPLPRGIGLFRELSYLIY
jgi:putative tricarboxylic transport membrane protein